MFQEPFSFLGGKIGFSWVAQPRERGSFRWLPWPGVGCWMFPFLSLFRTKRSVRGLRAWLLPGDPEADRTGDRRVALPGPWESFPAAFQVLFFRNRWVCCHQGMLFFSPSSQSILVSPEELLTARFTLPSRCRGDC